MHTEWTFTSFRSPTRTVFGGLSQKLIGVVEDVPTETAEQQLKNDLGSIAMKCYGRNSQPLPLIELTFESESEYQIAVSHGIIILNMHFKVEPKNTKIRLIKSCNCQNWVNHVSKMCNYQPASVVCGNDHPSGKHKEHVCRNSHKHNESSLLDS